MPENLIQNTRPTTKADLSTTLGNIDVRLALIENTMTRLDNAVNGNGKPGLLDEFRAFTQRLHENSQRLDRVEQEMTNHILNQNATAKDAKDLLAVDTKAAIDLLASEAKTSKEVLASEAKVVSDRKERISTRLWAVIIIVIAAVVTNAVGMIFLLLQNGIVR
jgi:hypothetical protein